MAKQDDDGVPFFYDRNQQGLRLLELPEEISSLLASNTPPILYLKSAPVPLTSDPSAPPPRVVLCTKSKTYQLRQVQTSNTVFVTKPSTKAQGGVTAYATAASTLELQELDRKARANLRTPESWLKDALGVYSGPDEENYKRETRAEILADVPFSEAECLEAWKDMAAFQWRGGCWRPAPEIINDVWTSLSQTATTLGIDLTGTFDPSELQDTERDDLPAELFEAIFSAITKHSDQREGGVYLDKDKTINWLGFALIEAPMVNDTDAGIWRVLQNWQNALPEEWRKAVTTKEVMALRAKVQAASAKETSGEQTVAGLDQGPKRHSTARNWHEKLKRVKN